MARRRTPYQLSTLLDFGKYEGVALEDVIERLPGYVEDLVEHNIITLAPGAARYLRETLEEFENDK